MFRQFSTLMAVTSAMLLGIQCQTSAAVDYGADIKPLLAEKCAACHGSIKQEAGLRLDQGGLLRAGGDSGQIIDAEEVGKSELITRITSDDDSLAMPPPGEGERLTQAQVELLRKWISLGAPSPEDEAIPVGPDEHWAWQRVRRPGIPVDVPAAWSNNPIDAFVYRQLQLNGLTENLRLNQRASIGVAAPNLSLRRLSFDLRGLPPTLNELRRLESEDVQWSEIVDEFLASPAYGQRWAKHWMDVWRYSDWDGYKDELRGSQRHVWRWRDWIVQSLCEDKGYDQMILEMLAADELFPEDNDALRATAFLARNFHKSNRNIWLDATVEHTAKAFLATTINCARCHDHKYDPISQQEYYAFRAIFEPHHVRTERIPGQSDLRKDGLVRAFDKTPDAKTYLYVGGNEKQPDEDHPIAPGVLEVVGLPFSPTVVTLPPMAFYPSLNRSVFQEDLSAAQEQVAKTQAALSGNLEQPSLKSEQPLLKREHAEAAKVASQAKLDSLQKRYEAEVFRFVEASGKTSKAISEREARLKAAAMQAERNAKIALARLEVVEAKQVAASAQANFDEAQKANQNVDPQKAGPNVQQSADSKPKVEAKAAGQLKSLQEALAKATKSVKKKREALANVEAAATENYSALGTIYPRQSTGRRAALARWIIDRDNPLTARVAVNHVWMHLIGEPLVENTFDFGMRSASPEHIFLLDFLSAELIENDWSLQHIVRLIVNSRTYRLGSTRPRDETVQEHERILELFGRGRVRRLDAEAIRDSLLAFGGVLDLQLGGPEIPYGKGQEIFRRSLYFQHAYEKQMTMLVVFDAAAPTECYRRGSSVVPQQALALANSPLAIDQSRLLARNIWQQKEQARDKAKDSANISRLFRTVLTRQPTLEELAACQDFLWRQEELLSSNELAEIKSDAKPSVAPAAELWLRARENLVHVIMNTNDFVTLR